ncbi:MAG: hypothetical protein ACJAZ3_000212 [Sphingobacteriales bacterium]|jgi:hypothetical protein
MNNFLLKKGLWLLLIVCACNLQAQTYFNLRDFNKFNDLGTAFLVEDTTFYLLTESISNLNNGVNKKRYFHLSQHDLETGEELFNNLIYTEEFSDSINLRPSFGGILRMSDSVLAISTSGYELYQNKDGDKATYVFDNILVFNTNTEITEYKVLKHDSLFEKFYYGEVLMPIDSFFIVPVFEDDKETNSYRAFFIVLDSNLNAVNEIEFYAGKNYENFEIFQVINDTLILAMGRTQRNSPGVSKATFSLISINGKKLYQKEFLTSGRSLMEGGFVKNNQIVLAAGTYREWTNNSVKMLQISLDLNNPSEVLWENNTIADSFFWGYYLLEPSINGFWGVGSTKDKRNKPANVELSNFHLQGLLDKYNNKGELQFSRYFHSPIPNSYEGTELWEAKSLTDGGLLVTGYVTNPTGSFTRQDAPLLRVDSNGCVEKGCELVGIKSNFPALSYLDAWPNPLSVATTIMMEIEPFSGKAALEIFDLNGRIIYQQEVRNGRSDIRIERSKFSTPGLYLYTLNINGRRLETRKLVVK